MPSHLTQLGKKNSDRARFLKEMVERGGKKAGKMGIVQVILELRRTAGLDRNAREMWRRRRKEIESVESCEKEVEEMEVGERARDSHLIPKQLRPSGPW